MTGFMGGGGWRHRIFLRWTSSSGKLSSEHPPAVHSEKQDLTDGGFGIRPAIIQDARYWQLREVVAQDLTDEEAAELLALVRGSQLADPYSKFAREARYEMVRLKEALEEQFSWSSSHFARDQLYEQLLCARVGVRLRWQALGIWNPLWAVPGIDGPERLPVPRWEWPWDSHDGGAGHDADAMAVQIKRRLPYGDYITPTPFACLAEGIDRARAIEFLITRPWYQLALESLEEEVRLRRLSREEQARYYWLDASTAVKQRWRERDDWQASWPPEGGWNWGYEETVPGYEGV